MCVVLMVMKTPAKITPISSERNQPLKSALAVLLFAMVDYLLAQSSVLPERSNDPQKSEADQALDAPDRRVRPQRCLSGFAGAALVDGHSESSPTTFSHDLKPNIVVHYWIIHFHLLRFSPESLYRFLGSGKLINAPLQIPQRIDPHSLFTTRSSRQSDQTSENIQRIGLGLKHFIPLSETLYLLRCTVHCIKRFIHSKPPKICFTAMATPAQQIAM
jgi:hypothetical protein